MLELHGVRLTLTPSKLSNCVSHKTYCIAFGIYEYLTMNYELMLMLLRQRLQHLRTLTTYSV